MSKFARWRVVLDGPAHGAWNMGVDEALLATAARTERPSFRLYDWQGAWLSLGYGQQSSPQLEADCARSSVGLVRRTTGGRAVLHGRDLTYSVAAPIDLLPAGLQGSYEALSEALVAALQALGVEADRSGRDAPAPGRTVFDCFQRPAAFEICVGGRKLAGSAQRRFRGAFLQHGSIRVTPDPPALTAVVGLSTGSATSLAEEGHRISSACLRQACVDSFSERLGGSWEPSRLTEDELLYARQRRDTHPQNCLELPGLAHTNDSRVPLSGR